MQTSELFRAVCAGLCLAAGVASAQGMPGMEEHAGHHHHADAEKLGAVSFPVSCSPVAAHGIEHGVALLHSFGYTEAAMQFEEVAKAEPTCAMAYWGEAMTHFTELWGPPDAENVKAGAEAMAKARALEAKVTPRERGYIEAMSAFYAAPVGTPYQPRADAYEAKMNALHAAYPADVEAAAFDALAILAAESPTDTSLTHEHQALAILVPLFQAHPDHPGLAHYIIHTCDTPALAQEGLSAAREYAKIAPSSAHALHMPGHIFARLGMWQEDIASNEASVKASEKAMAEHEPGAAHQLHADEFLVYAYLQVGEDAKAAALTDEMHGVAGHVEAMPGMDDMKEFGYYVDNELKVIDGMELHDWKRVEALQPDPESRDMDKLVTYWGNGVAAGHLHDAAGVSAALAKYDATRAIVMKQHPDRESAPDVRRMELAGWKAFANGNASGAVVFLREAANQQDKLGQGEVDIPAREMLGDLLMMEGKPEAALAEYRVALKLSPNRLNGLLSAGMAAEKMGDTADARAYYRAAAKQTDDARDSQRPELVHAVRMVGTDVAEIGDRD